MHSARPEFEAANPLMVEGAYDSGGDGTRDRNVYINDGIRNEGAVISNVLGSNRNNGQGSSERGDPVRYNIGVTIDNMGNTVSNIFRSRSRSSNIASFLENSDTDLETIV